MAYSAIPRLAVRTGGKKSDAMAPIAEPEIQEVYAKLLQSYDGMHYP